jgi:hypothetical protein
MSDATITAEAHNPSLVDLGNGRLLMDLAAGAVSIDGKHLLITSTGPLAHTNYSARLPLLALTRLVPGSATAGESSLRHPGTVALIIIWDGPQLILRVSGSSESIQAQRDAVAAAAYGVAWNGLVFPMSAARAEAVRRHIRGGDIPTDLPGLTPLFRAEFATPLDLLPEEFLSTWRSRPPDIGATLATLMGSGGTYLVLGASGVALGRAGEEIRWAHFPDLMLPVGAVNGSAITLALRARDRGALGTITFDLHEPGLDEAIRHICRRVIAGQLDGLPEDPIGRLEWAQRLHDDGSIDDGMLALAVQLILHPQVVSAFPEAAVPYPPQPRASRPQPGTPPGSSVAGGPVGAPAAAPITAPAPAPMARPTGPSPRQAMQSVRAAGMLAGLAASLFDDE